MSKGFLAHIFLIAAFSASVFAQSKHILAIAHRGEHLHPPENTIAAFQAAVDAGADFFELDGQVGLQLR